MSRRFLRPFIVNRQTVLLLLYPNHILAGQRLGEVPDVKTLSFRFLFFIFKFLLGRDNREELII